MKKILQLIIAGVLMLSMYSIAFAELEEVIVTIPEFDVTVNKVLIDTEHSQYPVILYKNITYFPMTYDMARAIDVEISFNSVNGFSIKKGQWSKRDKYDNVKQIEQIFLDANNTFGSEHTAKIANYPITVNGSIIDNLNEEYPILMFKDITYFPMTFRYAFDEFDTMTGFDAESGLRIFFDEYCSKKNSDNGHYVGTNNTETLKNEWGIDVKKTFANEDRMGVIKEHIKQNYSFVHTPLGDYYFDIRISDWNSNSIYIKLENDKLIFLHSDLSVLSDYTQEAIVLTKDILKNNMTDLMNYAWKEFDNDLPISGSYYNSWYKYKYISEGFRYIEICKAYIKEDILTFSKNDNEYHYSN